MRYVSYEVARWLPPTQHLNQLAFTLFDPRYPQLRCPPDTRVLYAVQEAKELLCYLENGML